MYLSADGSKTSSVWSTVTIEIKPARQLLLASSYFLCVFKKLKAHFGLTEKLKKFYRKKLLFFGVKLFKSFFYQHIVLF